ncbi:TPM domain-containing protein [bacterium]|nr:TPM domain-containing protein [bacterium]
MNEKIKCRLCGQEYDKDREFCPGCGVATEILSKKVIIPPPRGSVNDYAGVLTDDEITELSGMLEENLNRTGIPVVVATLRTTDPLLPSEYAFHLYNSWGIGKPKINRGLLILLSVDQKHVECEVGLGLEKYIPEKEGDEIVQETFIPFFKDGSYYFGLKAGTEMLLKIIREKVPQPEK